MVYEFTSITDLIKDHLEQNSLSQRSFAKQTKIDSSLISRVLREERTFSYAEARKLSSYFQLTTEEFEYLALLTEFQMVHSQKAKKLLRNEILCLHNFHKKKEISSEEFEIIGDFETLLTLEALELRSMSVQEVSEILRVTKEKTLQVINKLETLGLIEKEHSSEKYSKVQHRRINYKVNFAQKTLHKFFNRILDVARL